MRLLFTISLIAHEGLITVLSLFSCGKQHIGVRCVFVGGLSKLCPKPRGEVVMNVLCHVCVVQTCEMRPFADTF